MKTKPTLESPVKVYKIRHIWRGMFTAEWTDLINYPRTFTDLFRKVDGAWTTGENHPTGCRSSSLRPALPEIAAALSAHEIAR